MTTYLIIIITFFVLTQIVRVIQNGISLRKHSEVDKHNDELMEIFRNLSEDVADIKAHIMKEVQE